MDNIIAKPTKTREILTKYDLKLYKGLGQNFLIDQNILRKIIKAAKIKGDETVIEIGPGIGSLTQQILISLTCGRLIAIEKDQRLIKVLNDLFSANTNLELINKDVMKISWDQFIKANKLENINLKILANLPYYITTPIIMNLLESNLTISKMIFMVQKEVAERMIASPGNKDFGSLSVAVQFYTEAKIVFNVPPTVFLPQPGVYSSIIALNPYSELPYEVINRDFFFKIVQAIFQQRRKNIKNSLVKAAAIDLKKKDVLESLRECQIDPGIRGEKLDIEKMAQLSNFLWHKIS